MLQYPNIIAPGVASEVEKFIMKIREQEGFKPTEKLLSRLCKNTFFDLFSCLNLAGEDGKEL